MRKIQFVQSFLLLNTIALLSAAGILSPQKSNGETGAQIKHLTFASYRDAHALVAPNAIKFYGMRWELIAKAPKWDACV